MIAKNFIVKISNSEKFLRLLVGRAHNYDGDQEINKRLKIFIFDS